MTSEIVGFTTTDYAQFRVGTPEREMALHSHYASNAMACGHAATCEKVTAVRNWPTIMGRPKCTCNHG